MIWTSGTTPAVADSTAKPGSRERFGDTRTQATSILKNIQGQLVKQGLSMKDVVYLRAYLVPDPAANNRIDMTGWSAAYGEFFGPTGVLPVLWLEPLEEPMRLLGAAVGLGAVLLAVAYGAGIVNRWREGGPAAALYSTVHGAGRVMSRSEAKGKRRGREVVRAGRVDWPAVRRRMKDLGIELRGGGADEAPECYKRLTDVLAAHAGTVRILHTLRPIGVAMAGPEVADPYRD